MPTRSSKHDEKQDKARIRAYFDRLPPRTRSALTKLRSAIRSAAPGATETVSYGIPAFRLDGRFLVWYAAWKNHTSIYPIGTAIRRANAEALEGYVSSKATIRFPLSEPFPSALLKKLVKSRMAELRPKRKGKSPAK